jgi:hypothetical protein
MRFFHILLTLAPFVAFSQVKNECLVNEEKPNGCVTFSVSSGTGCAWMCNYCETQLGTNNYYFTDGVCTYQEGQGCVGNPIAGKTYTCCMV